MSGGACLAQIGGNGVGIAVPDQRRIQTSEPPSPAVIRRVLPLIQNGVVAPTAFPHLSVTRLCTPSHQEATMPLRPEEKLAANHSSDGWQKTDRRVLRLRGKPPNLIRPISVSRMSEEPLCRSVGPLRLRPCSNTLSSPVKKGTSRIFSLLDRMCETTQSPYPTSPPEPWCRACRDHSQG
jgi:hypothetical protein